MSPLPDSLRTTLESHLVPRNDVIRETLDWFDQYLGEPGG